MSAKPTAETTGAGNGFRGVGARGSGGRAELESWATVGRRPAAVVDTTTLIGSTSASWPRTPRAYGDSRLRGSLMRAGQWREAELNAPAATVWPRLAPADRTAVGSIGVPFVHRGRTTCGFSGAWPYRGATHAVHGEPAGGRRADLAVGAVG